MDNQLDNGKCPKCGALTALVGRIHNCRPLAAAPLVQTETYKYRDPVKRREQVAAAMREYRKRKKDGVRKTGSNVAKAEEAAEQPAEG
jgi:hypothetical protein